MATDIILHIPHASAAIPPEIRKEILLDDEELNRELLLMTDLHTDEIPVSLGQASVIKAPFSRLVVDVERFRDDGKETMAKAGMGAVYSKTHDGRPLRHLPPGRREALLERYYDPHHRKLTQAVEEALGNFGRCLIVDVHSFSSVPLPHEPDQSRDRPDICLGTDSFHTPAGLFEHAGSFFEKQRFLVKKNRPFDGTMVPEAYYLKNPLVSSIMVEINRKWLADARTETKKPGTFRVLASLADWIREAGGRMARRA